MKVVVAEHDGCFGVDLEPETIAEAALLVRFALNATKETRSLNTYAYGAGNFVTGIVFGKRRKPTNEVKS